MWSSLLCLKTPVKGFVIGVLAVAGAVSVASADVTFSTSTAPISEQDASDLNSSLEWLLSIERKAVSRIDPDRIRVIASAPTVSQRPAARGDKLPAPSISYTRSWVADQPTAKGGADWLCLSEALYFEARGESVKGQFAVAEVIMNRVKSSKFPGSVCGVVNQGTGKLHRCQFSYTCDGHPENIKEPSAYRNVGKIARALLDGAPRILTVGATYYHNHTVRPRWSRVFTRTASIDGHYFYR